MARFWLGPWEWQTGIIPHWRAPAGSVGRIDLRSIPQCAAAGPALQGDGLFVTGNGVTLPDHTLLGQAANPDDVTLSPAARSAWRTRFALPNVLTGPSLTQVLYEHLATQGDPLGDDRCLPLVPSQRHFELWLARTRVARILFTLAGPEALPLLDLLKRIYRQHRQDSLDGKTPAQHYRKVLGSWVRKYGIPYRNFQPADLPDESDLDPTTTYSDDFNRADAADLGASWSNFENVNKISGNSASNETVSDYCSSTYASDLSSADHYSEATGAADSAYVFRGTLARKDSSSTKTCYVSLWDTDNALIVYKRVAGTFTSIDSATKTFASTVMRLVANGSTISVNVGGVEELTASDSAITGNLRGGIILYGSTALRCHADNFVAEDLAGGTTFTGSGAIALDAATCAGTATFAAPVYSGTGAISTEAAVCAGSGIFATAVYSGAGAAALDAATASGSGSFTVPTYSGTGAVTLPETTTAGVGTMTAPIYSGIGAISLSAVTCTGAGTFTGAGAVVYHYSATSMIDVTDNADGTGGVATITGSAGAANSLYYSPWTGAAGDLSWTLLGTRSGDGTIAIASPSPVPLGSYVWRNVTSTGGISEAYQNLSSALAEVQETIHPRIKAAAMAAIKELELVGGGIFAGISQRVYSQLLPDETGLLFPCVILTTEGERERRLAGDSRNQRWQYPVRIWVADRESPRKHEKEALYMSWRKRIISLFDERPLGAATVPEAEGCTVEPEVIFDPKMPQYQHIISGVVLWVSTTEGR